MLEWFGRRQTIALPINSVVGCLIATILLCEARQRFNCLRHIPASWDREVKQDRQEIRLRSSSRSASRATEDQYRLGSNRVDHVTDLLVMEQKIDELRDLNRGLVLRRDNQVPLLGPLQFYTPSGYAVDAAAGEISVRKIGLHQDSPAGFASRRFAPREVRPVSGRSWHWRRGSRVKLCQRAACAPRTCG